MPGDPNQKAAGADGPKRFVALPFQLIERENAVVLRRGRVQLLVSGDRALETVQTLAEALAGDGATIADVCGRFAAPDRPAVVELIDQLSLRKFVVPAGSDLIPVDREGPLDLFYWHVGVSTAEVTRRLNQVRLAVVGVNHISHQLGRSLAAAGTTNFEVIDYPFLRNLSLFDEHDRLHGSRWSLDVAPVPFHDWQARVRADSFDCLVATSDFGGFRSMARWNGLCLEFGRIFLPITLQDLIGYVGPLVVPGETACFECYAARVASHRYGGDVELPDEQTAFDGQRFAGLHPSMASVLGDIGVIELTKFYSRALPLWHVGSLTEVNLLAMRLESRKILRVPRCRACGAFTRRSSTSLLRDSGVGERPGP